VYLQRGFGPLDRENEGSDGKFGARREIVHPLQKMPSRPNFTFWCTSTRLLDGINRLRLIHGGRESRGREIGEMNIDELFSSPLQVGELMRNLANTLYCHTYLYAAVTLPPTFPHLP
jgi:hypothetical protein